MATPFDWSSSQDIAIPYRNQLNMHAHYILMGHKFVQFNHNVNQKLGRLDIQTAVPNYDSP